MSSPTPIPPTATSPRYDRKPPTLFRPISFDTLPPPQTTHSDAAGTSHHHHLLPKPIPVTPRPGHPIAVWHCFDTPHVPSPPPLPDTPPECRVADGSHVGESGDAAVGASLDGSSLEEGEVRVCTPVGALPGTASGASQRPSCATIVSIETNNSLATPRALDFSGLSPRKPQRLSVDAGPLGSVERAPTPPTVCVGGEEEEGGEEGEGEGEGEGEVGVCVEVRDVAPAADAHGVRFRDLVTVNRERGMFERKVRVRKSADAVLMESKEEGGVGGGLGRRVSVQRSLRAGPLMTFRSRGAGGREGRADVDETNPWFQERGRGEEVGEALGKVQSSTASQSEGLGVEQAVKVGDKGRKKRFKKLGRIFRREDGSRSSMDDVDILSSSSSESMPAASSSMEAISGGDREESHDQSGNLESLEEDLRAAISRKENLIQVLDLVTRLRDRPGEELEESFFKYLGMNSVLEQGIKMLLEDVDSGAGGGALPVDRKMHRQYRDVLVYCYASGPRRLKKAFLQNNKARGELFTFLGCLHSKRLSSPQFHLQIHNLVSVLNGLLRDFPAEFAEIVHGKKGFLHFLVKNYIHIPEVVDLLCQLTAADALSDTDEDKLRYGQPNAHGIMVLAREEIPNVLVYTFGEASFPRGSVLDEKLRWQLQVMSLKCLLELGKRASAVLKFTRGNCSYSSKFIKQVNSALDALSPYAHTERVSVILDSGLGSVRQLGNESKFEEVNECNNAGVCALSFVLELLDTVRTAADSKSVVIRRNVGSIDTRSVERLVLERAADLCQLLSKEKIGVVRGRLRTTTAKLFRSLLGSANEETKNEVSRRGVTQSLLKALRDFPWASILHGCVVECIALSLARDTTGQAQHMWMRSLQSVGMLEEMVVAIEGRGGGGGDEEGWRSTYASTLVDIGFVVCLYSQRLTRAKFRGMFESAENYERFTSGIEGGLRRVVEQRRGACGGPKPEGAVVSVLANADALAARLDDFEAV